MKNLIDDRKVTTAFLSNPLQWRVRVVEELTVDAATHCLRRRSLQVAPLRPMLGDQVDSEDSEALVALNVAPMPRGPLLDFSIDGPKGDAWLLPRTEIAQRQADYLAEVAAAANCAVDATQYKVLAHLLGFSESGWDFSEKSFKFDDYLEDGLGLKVSEAAVQEWRAIGISCRTILGPYSDSSKVYSVCEEPALALPSLYDNSEGLGFNEAEGTEYLQSYIRLLKQVKAASNDSGPSGEAASEFLEALADYGRYYDLIVAVKVPLDEPFLIKYSERRSIRLDRFRNIGKQELVISDAQSNHVTFKVADPNVRIVGFKALKPGSEYFAYGSFLARSDEQTKSFYAHGIDRDYRVELVFKLALLSRLQLVPYFAAALISLLAVALLLERTNDLKTLALVVGPSALAASVLLAREPSTLGSRLRLLSTVVLGAALVGLVLAAVVSYLCGTFCD